MDVVAFDVMWISGRDYRNKPLLERKKALRKIVPTNSPYVLYADYVSEHGVELFRTVCDRDLEGIVAKQKDAPYSDSVRWVKIKNPGYIQAAERQEQFQPGALNRVTTAPRAQPVGFRIMAAVYPKRGAGQSAADRDGAGDGWQNR